MNKIFFTADLHFGHQNILKNQPGRPFVLENDTTAHDEWLLDLWKSTIELIRRIRFIYLVIFITGNHDGAIKAHSNYFRTTAQISDITIRPTICPRLAENMMLSLCHYLLLT